MVASFSHDSVLRPFSNGVAAVESGKKWYLINKSGNALTSGDFPVIKAYMDDMLVIQMDETYRGRIHQARGYIALGH
jgi:hypothetical protein